MASPIGFLLITHRDPGQIVRLVDRLHRLYGRNVPIAIHHDQGQCRLDPRSVPGALMVAPRSTAWGNWGVVEATLDGLRLLHEGPSPEYTVLLSGADYPVAPPERVIAELQAGGADAYVRAHPVRIWRRDRSRVPPREGFGVNQGAMNQRLCFKRYYGITFKWGRLRYRMCLPLVVPWFSPFSRTLRPYAGEQWWILGRKAVPPLLAAPGQRPDLVRWYGARILPDEGYVQTIVWNVPALRMDRRNFRYVDWNGAGPKQLDHADLPYILESGAHFARKFSPDHPVLDEIDRHLGLPPWAGQLAAASGA